MSTAAKIGRPLILQGPAAPTKIRRFGYIVTLADDAPMDGAAVMMQAVPRVPRLPGLGGGYLRSVQADDIAFEGSALLLAKQEAHLAFSLHQYTEAFGEDVPLEGYAPVFPNSFANVTPTPPSHVCPDIIYVVAITNPHPHSGCSVITV